jgi:hypothetical protein
VTAFQRLLLDWQISIHHVCDPQAPDRSLIHIQCDPNARCLPGWASPAFAALLLELALTRLFSVVLFYHFAFLAISIALLGLGAGGVFRLPAEEARLASAGTRTLGGAPVHGAIPWWCSLVLEIVLHVPVRSGFGREFSSADYVLPGRGRAFLSDWIAVLGGVCARDLAHSAALRRRPVWRSAGLPGRGSAAELDRRTEWILARRSRHGWRRRNDLGSDPHSRAESRPGALCAGCSDRGEPFRPTDRCGLRQGNVPRSGSWVEFARWNALSRVEVDRQGQAKAIVIDADASTYIMNAIWRTVAQRSGRTT